MPDNPSTVWCLLGKKAGDNTQVRALATALGALMDVVIEEKHIVARPWELLTHLALKVTLAGIDTAESSPLAAPWPDLVITAGRRNEPVARWIQQQAGGTTRLVHLGRPWAPLDCWDLIVTTPQYFLPQQANILHNTLPLHSVQPEQRAAAAAHWQPRWQHLPRPWIAVLVGGDSGRYVLTPGKGARLGVLASQLAGASGGSLLVTDSPRTPADAVSALQAHVAAPHFVHRCAQSQDNPYQGMLALADVFIVTGESMSMLAEAADTGRGLFIFDPGDGATPWWQLPHAWRYKPLSFRAAMAFGPQRMRRDIGRIQGALVASGRARWLEEKSVLHDWEAAPMASAGNDAAAELTRSAAALRQLLIQR